MTRTARREHALDVMHRYSKLTNADVYRETLDARWFRELPEIFFRTLADAGYAFKDLTGPPYGTHAQAHLEELMALAPNGNGRVQVRSVRGVNIFWSMEGDATVDLVTRGEQKFLFLHAQYLPDVPETLPIMAEKREYAQPVTLQEVLKRLHNAKFRNS